VRAHAAPSVDPPPPHAAGGEAGPRGGVGQRAEVFRGGGGVANVHARARANEHASGHANEHANEHVS
jgi:hypothetical protein